MNITRHLYSFTFQFQVLVILKINEKFNNSSIYWLQELVQIVSIICLPSLWLSLYLKNAMEMCVHGIYDISVHE